VLADQIFTAELGDGQHVSIEEPRQEILGDSGVRLGPEQLADQRLFCLMALADVIVAEMICECRPKAPKA